LPLTIAPNVYFMTDTFPTRHLTTDANGRWSVAYPAPINEISAAYGQDAQTPFANFASAKLVYIRMKTAFWVVTIRASSSHAPATISGAVLKHGYGRRVWLEKKVGSTW